jgi:hypothetical protein
MILVETMGDASSPDVPLGIEIQAGLKPIAPLWQWVVAITFFVFGFAGLPQAFDLVSIVFFISLLVGIATVFALLSRKETIPVTISSGEDCILITDPTRPGKGRLIPSRVVQEDDHTILVHRAGRRWELGQMEFRFANTIDATRAKLLFKRFLPKP